MWEVSQIESKTRTQKVGKIGELTVASQLLKHADNVYLPLVDYGVDLIVLVRNKFKKIQVKTAEFRPKEANYHYTFSKSTLDNISGSDSFFIFVLKSKEKVDYLVVPTIWLRRQIQKRKIKADKNNICHLYLYEENSEIFHWIEDEKYINLSKYLNNWDIIQ